MGLDNSVSLKILYNSQKSIFKIKNIAIIGYYFPPILDNNPYLQLDKHATISSNVKILAGQKLSSIE